MARFKSEPDKRAETILAGAAPMESELQGLAKTLQDEGSVGLARRILEQ